MGDGEESRREGEVERFYRGLERWKRRWTRRVMVLVLVLVEDDAASRHLSSVCRKRDIK